MATVTESHPEDVGGRAFVGGLEGHEGDAVVQRRVAQHARPENGVFRDVARGVDAGEDVRETLLDGLGVSVPHHLLRAGLLHVTLRGKESRQGSLPPLYALFLLCLRTRKKKIKNLEDIYISLSRRCR